MKNILQQIAQKNKEQEKAEAAAFKAEIENPATGNHRRSFLKKVSIGGITLSGFMGASIGDTVAQATSKVQRTSNPSDLKITDMRYATVSNGTAFTNARNVIIRIDTNQGIYGLGEVRDGGDARYALMLKSRFVREKSM